MALSKQTLIWTASFLFLGLVAAVITFSWVQAFHTADSLLSALISIDRFTPYYWGENRFGQPLPLVTSFIHGYATNLYAENLLLVSSSLGCVVLFNLYFLHRELNKLQRLTCAVLSMFIGLCLLTPSITALHTLAIGAQPYMPSLFLMLAALALIFRSETFPAPAPALGALACLGIAAWLNSSIALFTVSLLVLLDFDLRRPRWKRRLWGLGLAAVAFAANSILASRYPGPRLLAFIPARDWFLGMMRFGRQIWPQFFHEGRLLAFVGLLLAIVVLKRGWRSFVQSYSAPDVAAFAFTSCAYAAAIAATQWVSINRHSPRYLTIPAMLFLFTSAGWVSGTWARWLRVTLRSETGPLLLAECLLALLALGIFGLPSSSKAGAYLAQNTNRYDADLRALGCTHFVGDYWTGWTAVFQRENTGGPPLYAITARSEVTRDRWDWAPERRRTYCGLQGDKDREIWARTYGLPALHETTVSGIFRKLEAAPQQPARPPAGN